MIEAVEVAIDIKGLSKWKKSKLRYIEPVVCACGKKFIPQKGQRDCYWCLNPNRR